MSYSYIRLIVTCRKLMVLPRGPHPRVKPEGNRSLSLMLKLSEREVLPAGAAVRARTNVTLTIVNRKKTTHSIAKRASVA